jgi:heptaprenyl diphosphate synthase
VAILSGDFLFSRASDLLADLGPEAVRIQARTFERLVIGQIKETVGAADGTDPVTHHIEVLEDKTGSLIATSGRFGAMFGGCDDAVVETLTLFGERIGVAFQLADDLVDLTSADGESGKTQGRDLREGVRTLPMLLALASSDPADARLQELLAGPLPDDDDHAEALALLLAHPAVAGARAEALRWADDARASLAPLPDIPAKEALEMLCDFVVTRTS